MGSTNLARIFRVMAGGALLMPLALPSLADYYVPEGAGLWKPHMSADMAGPGRPDHVRSRFGTPVFEAYFTNLEPLLSKLDPGMGVSDPLPPGYLRPEPRFIWIYHYGKWTLAIGPDGAGDDSPLTAQLLKQVDEPATFLVTGVGLILLILASRHHRRHAAQQKSRLSQQKSRTTGRTGVRLIFRLD